MLHVGTHAYDGHTCLCHPTLGNCQHSRLHRHFKVHEVVWGCLDACQILTAHLLLGTLCNLLLLVDVIGEGLGGSDDCDGSFILQNVAFSSRQHLDDLVLNLSQLASVVSSLRDGTKLSRYVIDIICFSTRAAGPADLQTEKKVS